MNTIAARVRRPTSLQWQLLWLFLICLVCTHPAWADSCPPAPPACVDIGGTTGSFGLFDSFLSNNQKMTSGWANTISGIMTHTFDLLAAIEICWAAAIWVFEKDNMNSLALELVKKIMFLSFFFMVLQNGPGWVQTISDSFEQAGVTATNKSGTNASQNTSETTNSTSGFSTDTVIAEGLAVNQIVWNMAPTAFFDVVGAIGKLALAALVTVVILVSYTILAAQYFTTKVESLICFAAGAVFLGLGATSWTKDYTHKYLNYAVVVGVRLLIIILLCALLSSFMAEEARKFSFDYAPLLHLLAMALMQLMLALKAPEMASALLNGGAGVTAGGLKQAMGAAVAAAMGPTKMALSAAQGANNFKQAVSAGTSLAKAGGKSGMSATLSGLGSAAKATAKEMPASVMNAVKGRSGMGGQGGGMGGGMGQQGAGMNPGAIDRAKQGLQGKLQQLAGGGGGSGGNAGGGGGGSGGGGSGVGGLSRAAGGGSPSGGSPSGGGFSGGGGGFSGGGSGGGGSGGGAPSAANAASAAVAATAAESGSGGGSASSAGSAGGSDAGSPGSSSDATSTSMSDVSPSDAPPPYSLQSEASSFGLAAQSPPPPSSLSGRRPKPRPATFAPLTTQRPKQPPAAGRPDSPDKDKV